MWLFAYIKSLGYTPTIGVEGVITVTTDVKATTLFCCHVDTCHSAAESDGSMQALAYDPDFGHLMLADKTKSRCLGADDGAGIYILLKLLTAKIPGSYIFCTGEEKGGIGSRAFTAKNHVWLENFDRSVAFDRADNFEVICTQGGKQCASPQAGAALVAMLTQHMGMKYEVSHKGSFTDTKVFADIIPECFNVAAGYMHQHGPDEYQDLEYLEELAVAVVKIPWASIPTMRKPVFVPPYNPPYSKPATGPQYSRNAMNGIGLYDEDMDDDIIRRPAAKVQAKPVIPPLSLMQEIEDFTYEDFVNLVDDDPSVAADLLCSLFVKKKALEAECAAYARFFS